jgi:hypothetical protein
LSRLLKLRFEFAIMAAIAGLFSLTACAVLIPPSPSDETSGAAIDQGEKNQDSGARTSKKAPDTPETLRTPDPLQTIKMSRELSQEVAPSPGEPYLPPANLPTIPPRIDTPIDTLINAVTTPKPEPAQALNARPANYSFLGDTDDYFVSGFACTGSMRPALDCGDEAVFLNPPFPQPPSIGDVVSFSVDLGCRYYKSQDVSKAHRIINIRYEGTTPFYTTQGDASSDPDPCEVTLEQMDGVLVEVRKGARPQDIIDASEYDRAKLAVTELKAEYALRLDLYNLERVTYEALVEEYNSLVDHYRRGDLSYQVVSEFYQGLEERRTSLNTLRQDLNDLSDRINLAIDEVDRLYRQLFVS